MKLQNLNLFNLVFKISFYLMIVLFSFGQLGRISLLGQQINTYLYELFLVFNLSLLLIKYKLHPFGYYLARYKAIFIFSIILLISYLINIYRFNLLENFISLLYLVRVTTYFSFLLYSAYYLKTNEHFRKTLLNTLNIFMFLTIISSVVQYLYYQDLRNLFYLGWDPHLYRMFGVFFDPFVSSAVYGLLFFLVLFKFKGLLKQILLTILFIFLGLTFSRMAYTAFLTALFIYFIYKKFYKEILIVSIVFVGLILLIPKPSGEGVNLKRVFSLETRIGDYGKSFGILKSFPVFGIGYNHIRYIKKQLGLIEEKNWDITHAGASFHSSFLTILVSSGIAGLLAFLLILFSFAKINIYAKTYVIFLSIFSLADNVLLHPFILLLFFTILLLEFNLSSR